MAPKTVLITGCSDGSIGSALALTFQQRGFQVFATARNLTKCSALAGVSNIKLLEMDVTSPETIAATVSHITEQTNGTLDYLVNNAARIHYSPVLDQDIEEQKRMWDTNVCGPTRVVQAFSPLILKAKGTFVFISSIGTKVNMPWFSTYAATKSGMEIIAETLRLEVAPLGAKVLTVMTGGVQSMSNSYFDDFALPEGSLYKLIEAEIREVACGRNGFPLMPGMQYAGQVVDSIEQGREGKVWCGQQAGFLRVVTSCFPQSFIVSTYWFSSERSESLMMPSRTSR